MVTWNTLPLFSTKSYKYNIDDKATYTVSIYYLLVVYLLAPRPQALREIPTPEA